MLSLTALILTLAAGDEPRAYPAMRSGAFTYVIVADSKGQITKCLPADYKVAAAETEAACTKLTAKGLPADVVPATPATRPETWVTADDFPPDKFKKNASVEVIFEVNANGRVADCAAYVPSGDPAFDTAACAAMIARARFRPATYKSEAVLAVTIQRVNFSRH